MTGNLKLVSGASMASVLLVIMYAVYAASQPVGLTIFGFNNIVNNGIPLALAAAGLTLVVLVGELDLSGIGILTIANVVVATTSTGLLGTGGSLILVSLIGLAIGLINGWFVTVIGLQSLAVTLGTLIISGGVALIILPAPGGQVTDAITYGLTDTLGGMPVALWVLLAVILLWLYLKRTALGIALYAVGTDATAAQLSGIDIRFTKLFAFAISGLFYALAGYYLSAEISSGDPRINDTFLLLMYASVAVGGTSLNGGSGGVVASIVGAGILTVMHSMLLSLGVAGYYTSIFSGLIMLAAIGFGQLSSLVARPGSGKVLAE